MCGRGAPPSSRPTGGRFPRICLPGRVPSASFADVAFLSRLPPEYPDKSLIQSILGLSCARAGQGRARLPLLESTAILFSCTTHPPSQPRGGRPARLSPTDSKKSVSAYHDSCTFLWGMEHRRNRYYPTGRAGYAWPLAPPRNSQGPQLERVSVPIRLDRRRWGGLVFLRERAIEVRAQPLRYGLLGTCMRTRSS